MTLNTCFVVALYSQQRRLCIHLLLNGKFNEMVSIWGIKCSSWVSINKATSGRDFFMPMGNPMQPSVEAANLMVSRPCSNKRKASV